MSSKVAIDTPVSSTPPRLSEGRRIVRALLGRKVVLFGCTIIMLTIIAVIFAPWLAPYDPDLPDLGSALQQPSGDHLLGTDSLGRDTLSRIIYGARVSMQVSLMAIAMGAIVGLTLGTIAGYFGGIAHTIIMRFIDAIMAFPGILLALVIAALLGGGLFNVTIALGVGLVPAYARLMCGQVLSVKENDYILAQRSMAASNLRIIFSHIVPNCFPPLIVLITLMIGATIIAEAGLSFLGVGVAPPTASWGAMVSNGYPYLLTNPILSLVPGAVIMLVAFAFNMVGDGLRDALDPRLRGLL